MLKCEREHCNSKAVKNYLCSKHGAYGMCIEPGCDTGAYFGNGQKCYRHGLYRKCLCQTEGCNGYATPKSDFKYCYTHHVKVIGKNFVDGRARCSKCHLKSIKNSLCFKHGAYGMCDEPKCNLKAKHDQKCNKHTYSKEFICQNIACFYSASHELDYKFCLRHRGEQKPEDNMFIPRTSRQSLPNRLKRIRPTPVKLVCELA